MAEVTFGEWLKRRRKGMGWTQRQLAAQINCSTVMLKKIEAEERRPSAQLVEQLADIFNISTHERNSFLRFARGDWRSAPISENEDAPWHVSARSSRSNLPASLTSFIGREPDLAVLNEYLSDRNKRLITLIAPPGIGKTRLSIEAARSVLTEFPDGVFFVALAPLEDPSLIALVIIQALGYVEAKNIPARQQLVDGIGGKQMLILLDNCEHLIEDVAPLTSELLSACWRLKILATSREVLRVPGEWLYPVPTLAVPQESSSINAETASKFPALMLFAERARAVRPDFALNLDNIQAVSSICAQLDGLPLAIELMAARMRLMSPEALLKRLNDQFILFADGMRATSTRQKTLNQAIGWSYELLSAEEQKIFTYLSVFSGGFTQEMAEAVFSRAVTEKSISELITSLLDKSLLQRTLNPEANRKPRFNMLVTIQHYALERLQNADGEAEVRNWHLTYFLDLAEQADKEIHGPDQVEWLDRLEAEHHNYRAALDWCVSTQKTESALHLLGALGWPWFMRGYYGDARTWFDKIRAMPEVENYPAIYGKTLIILGLVGYYQGDFSSARIFLEQAQSIYGALGAAGKSGMAGAQAYLGLVVWWGEGDIKGGQNLLEKAAELYEISGNTRGYAEASYYLGFVTLGSMNQHALSLSLFERSLAIFSELGDLWGMGRLYHGLSVLFIRQENYARARRMAEQALANDQRIGFKFGIVSDLIDLGIICLAQGDDGAAMKFYQASFDICDQAGLKEDTAIALYYLGLLALHQRDYERATTCLTESLVSFQTQTDDSNVAERLAGLAAVAGGTNQPERAAKLSGAAQAILERTGFQYSPFDRAEFDHHIQIARDQLGEVRFESLQAEGRAMTMEQAIEYAFESPEST